MVAEKILVADTHVHIYPHYELKSFFSAAYRQLSALVPMNPAPRALVPILFLTERFDCSFFRDLSAGKFSLPTPLVHTVLEPTKLIKITLDASSELLVVAGRQIVSSEKLELLCLGSDTVSIIEGRPIGEAIEECAKNGLVPVIPWSPGKWLGRRGLVIRKLLESPSTPSFLLGDSALRPPWLPEPSLFQLARARGVNIVAGTDPLPLNNEEARVGSYANCWITEKDSVLCTQTLLSMLRKPSTVCGKRLTPFQVLRRLIGLKIDAAG